MLIWYIIAPFTEREGDHASNLWMVQPKANSSIEAQIYQKIKELPDGTPIYNIIKGSKP